MQTGYFADTKTDTKVHLVDSYSKPMCGCYISKDKKFQWNSHGITLEYIECVRCKKIALELLEKEHEKRIRTTKERFKHRKKRAIIGDAVEMLHKYEYSRGDTLAIFDFIRNKTKL